jgi:hypothetical protein
VSWEIKMRVVIVHAKHGVYLGAAIGLGFFSVLDCAGQAKAATFASRIEAEAHIRTWKASRDPADYVFYDVACDGEYATPDDLEIAGIPKHMIEPMRVEENAAPASEPVKVH